MKNELIRFTSGNNNDYFYDPLLKEIFIYSDQMYGSRAAVLRKDEIAQDVYLTVSAEDVEYQLANLGQITIEMTERCNLNCLYCTYGSLYSSVHRKGTDISFTFIRNILNYLVDRLNSNLNASTGNPFYISFYGGEPLLRFDDIKKTVDHVRQLTFRNIKVVFSMTTNGFFLDKYMDYLQENNFRLLLSLDGDGQGNGLRVDHQGKPQYDKIYGNIKALQKKYPAYFKSHVNFNAVLNKHNSVESITDFFEKEFDKLPQISDISSQGLKPDKIADFYNIYSSSFDSFAEAGKVMDIEKKYYIHHPLVMEAFIFLKAVCRNSYKDYWSLLAKGDMKRIPTGTCLPFFKRMFVSAKGLILPCENVSHDNPFGYVDEKGVTLDAEKIATLYNRAFQQLAHQCAGCYGSDICLECIFQMEKTFTCSRKIKKGDLEQKFSRAVTLIENNPELYVRMMKEVSVE